MGLRGQGGERGYAMAALLVSLAVMSVLMSVALPVWRHQARREKEAELEFRMKQYARAVALYMDKFQGTFPPNLDVLVQQKFLRKKYKDPITGGDFEPIYANSTAGQPGQPQQPQQPQPGGGIIGVRSKSKETSIKLFNSATRYDQWTYTFQMWRAENGWGRGGGAGGSQDAPGGGRGRGRGGVNTPGGRGPGGGMGFPSGPGGVGPGRRGGRGPGFLRPGIGGGRTMPL